MPVGSLSLALAAVLLLDPPPPPPVFTPLVREFELAGAFRLKTENFLAWQPVFSPIYGWQVVLRSTWRTELSAVDPRFSALSLAVEATETTADGFGTIRTRIQLALPAPESRVGLEYPALLALPTTLRSGFRSGRPVFFLSGRF